MPLGITRGEERQRGIIESAMAVRQGQNTGCRSSGSSARTHTSTSSYRHLLHTSPLKGAGAETGAGAGSPTSPSMVAAGSSKLHSSNLLASSSKLKAPTKMDAEKMLHKTLTSNASTGGNGIRRPYGRFIASRGGLALSVWERQAPMTAGGGNNAASRGGTRDGGTVSRGGLPSQHGSRPQTIAGPYFPHVKTAQTPPLGRNVSQYNVRRKAYTSRNMDISSKAVESKYSFQVSSSSSDSTHIPRNPSHIPAAQPPRSSRARALTLTAATFDSL